MQERWPSMFGNYVGSSFMDLLRTQAPERLPAAAFRDAPKAAGELPMVPGVPMGTTILALRYADGVIVAGDRQATEGYQVAHRRIEKVYKADDHSAVAIAGAAGPSIEMARLFQTELEHYEKVEGDGLSLEGKANKLAQMIRMNLPMAMQGLIVIPIFAGFDLKRGEGRIFKYDVTGGRYEEIDHYATGSGGKDARTTLKKLHRIECSRTEALRMAVEALVDAAEEDVGTGGPDQIHGIYPTMKSITRAGFEEIPETEVRQHCDTVLTERRQANAKG
jgi:proteasome beta subunit